MAPLAAFKTHSLVGLNDAHGLAQEQDFYAAVIRDPRFARDVGNVVLEGLTALHQATADRYVNGEDVPFVELRKLWFDSVATVNTNTGVMSDSLSGSLLSQIRITNMSLPSAQRIKVWLGEPPSDWTKINTSADFRAILAQRDRHGSDVINQNIMAKGKKALVIYGGAHFDRPPPLTRKTPFIPQSEALVRRYFTGVAQGAPNYDDLTPDRAVYVRGELARMQGSFAAYGALQKIEFVGGQGRSDTFILTFANDAARVVQTYDASGKIATTTRAPANAANDRVNIFTGVERLYPGAFYIVSPYTGYVRDECSLAAEQGFKPYPVPALITDLKGSTFEQEGDRPGCQPNRWADTNYNHAVLYLGPAASLTEAPGFRDPHLVGDPELARRQQIRGRPAPPPAGYRPASPLRYGAPSPAPPTEAARQAAFTASDSNADKRLDKFEFYVLLQTLGFADQIDTLFLQRDVNRDYFVSPEEYRTPIQ
jgi:hypothetical protein